MPKTKQKVILKCEWCENPFERKRPWQKYCCNQCRHEAWEDKNPRVKRNGTK